MIADPTTRVTNLFVEIRKIVLYRNGNKTENSLWQKLKMYKAITQGPTGYCDLPSDRFTRLVKVLERLRMLRGVCSVRLAILKFETTSFVSPYTISR